MAHRVFSNPKIEVVWDSVPVEYLTDDAGKMRAVRLRNLKNDQMSELEAKCVFVAIGHSPNTAPFVGKLDTDGNGYLYSAKAPKQISPASSQRATLPTTFTDKQSQLQAKAAPRLLMPKNTGKPIPRRKP